MNPTSDVLSLFDVQDKSVLVTGGSRGIGRMIAEAFVRGGARVYISARKAEACDVTAKELSVFGRCMPLPADLSTDDGCTELADAVNELEPHLDVLVNNAGNTWGAPLDTFPYRAFDRVWSLNVQGPFRLTQLLLPRLRTAAQTRGGARIIMIGSVNGIDVPKTDNFSYSASKAGIHMLTRHLAKILAPERITVNAIAPGLFPSALTDYLFAEEGFSEHIDDQIPLGRVGRPSDMAGAALYLGSAAGDYVTGTVLVVDGGLVGTSASI